MPCQRAVVDENEGEAGVRARRGRVTCHGPSATDLLRCPIQDRASDALGEHGAQGKGVAAVRYGRCSAVLRWISADYEASRLRKRTLGSFCRVAIDAYIDMGTIV